MEERKPQKGEVYRHFKGNLYEVIAIAKHSETLEEMVVYQDLERENQVYVRPLGMFMSKVGEDYRFQLVEEQSESEQTLLLTFLDLHTTTEKINFLQVKKDELTEDFIGLAAQCLEFAETKQGFEERYYDFVKYLKTLERFESVRG